jgi:hypothetical protein
MEALILLGGFVLIAMVIIWVIGVVLALSRWRRHPRVSLFALLAFGMILVSRFQNVLLPPIMIYYGWTENEMGSLFFAVVGLAAGLTSAIAWTFVLLAIFGWRDESQKQNIPPPSPSTFGNNPCAQNTTL